MVLPEGARDEDVRSRLGRAMLGALGLAGLVAGAILFGALTSPDPEAAPATSTTTTTTEAIERPVDLESFSVSQIAIGDGFRFERVATIEAAYPQTVVEHDGWTYVFGSPEVPWRNGPGPLVGWRSRDGIGWESLGSPLGDETPIAAVSATGGGLIAVERSADADGFGIWVSQDGTDWTRRPVPTQTGDPYRVVYPGPVYADNDTLLVTAGVAVDDQALLESLLKTVGVNIDLPASRGWSSDYVDGGLQLTVYGPFGMPIFIASHEELDLTEEELAMLTDGPQVSPEVNIWLSGAGGDWIRATMPDVEWLNNIVASGDGDLVAFGYGERGPASWRSVDGLTWIEEAPDPNLSEALGWNGSMVGARDGSPELFFSPDGGESWDPAQLADHFPVELSWDVSQLTATGSGLGAVVDGWRPNQTPSTPQARPDPPTLRDGAAVLHLDFEEGVLELDVGDETLSWRLFQNLELEKGLEIDLETETVVFHHPDTGEELAAFGFDELDRAEAEYWTGSFDEDHFQALVFSPDGEHWSIQDAAKSFGAASFTLDLGIADDRLVAVVVDAGDLYSNEANPGFEIWSSPIP